MQYTFNFQRVTTELEGWKEYIERRITTYFGNLLILGNADIGYLDRPITCDRIGVEVSELLNDHSKDTSKGVITVITTLDSLGGIKLDCEFITNKGEYFTDSFITVIGSYEKKYSLFDYIFKKKELEVKDILALCDYIIDRIVYDNRARIDANANQMING